MQPDSVPMIGREIVAAEGTFRWARDCTSMKKNRECSSTRLNLDIGERPQVLAGAAWPCATVVVRDTAGNLTPPVPPHRRTPCRRRTRSVAQGHDALAGTCGFLLRSRRTGSVPDGPGQFQSDLFDAHKPSYFFQSALIRGPRSSRVFPQPATATSRALFSRLSPNAPSADQPAQSGRRRPIPPASHHHRHGSPPSDRRC